MLVSFFFFGQMERLVVCRIQNEEGGDSKNSTLKFIASDIGGNQNDREYV